MRSLVVALFIIATFALAMAVAIFAYVMGFQESEPVLVLFGVAWPLFVFITTLVWMVGETRTPRRPS